MNILNAEFEASVEGVFENEDVNSEVSNEEETEVAEDAKEGVSEEEQN